MDNLLVGSQAAMSMVQGCIVVPVQADLYDDLLERIRRRTLHRIHSETVKGIVFDMSSVRVMDTYVFNHLMDTGKMAILLGVPAVFIGFQAGAVSALVDLEVDTAAVKSYRTVEQAIESLTAGASVGPAQDGDNDPVNPADDQWKRALDGYEPEL